MDNNNNYPQDGQNQPQYGQYQQPNGQQKPKLKLNINKQVDNQVPPVQNSQPQYNQPQYNQQPQVNYQQQTNYQQPIYNQQVQPQYQNPQQYNPYQQQQSQQYYPKVVQPKQVSNDPSGPKKSKAKMIIIISIIVAVLAAGGIVTWLLLSKKDSFGDKGFDTQETAINAFFSALNSGDEDKVYECFPDNLSDSQSDKVKRLVKDFKDFEVKIYMEELYIYTKPNIPATDSDGNEYSKRSGTFTFITKDIPKGSKANEMFTITVTTTKKNKYIITDFDFDTSSLIIVDDEKTTEKQTETPTTEEVTTEKPTEEQKPNIVGIAEKEGQLVQQIFSNANNRDGETLLWYFVPEEYATNRDQIKENIDNWMNNLKTTDIKYDLTTIKEVGDKKELGDWGPYKEYEREYTIEALTTNNGKFYTCRQSIIIQYIEAENHSYALTSFVLADDYDIISSEEITSETTETTEKPVETSGKWVNFDDMHFYINGKKYELGKVTLQDMIDAGVPFSDRDISKVSNTMNKNTEDTIRVDLGEYWTATLSFANYTDGDLKFSECTLCEVYYNAKKDSTQDVLTFDFPVTITKDDLFANSGTPDESKTYDDNPEFIQDVYKYTKDAVKYIGTNKFQFEFTNGVLQYLYITYRP